MSVKRLRNLGIRPNLEKDEGYENNNSYILKGQRVYNPQRICGALNDLYFKREIEESEERLKMSYLEILEERASWVIEEEKDMYGIRDEQLLELYCSMDEVYKNHKRFHKENIERAKEILKLIELTKTFKHIKGASNSKLIVFDLERKNIGEWE